MKQKLKIYAWTLMALILSSVGWAASDDTLLVFSTRGPDHYADGTAVQPGEMYALVWMRSGCDFAGFDLTGTILDATNNALVVALPLARTDPRVGGAHCPVTLFQIAATETKRHVGGTYALALLDTRVSDGQGGLRPSGRITDLKGWGLVDKAHIASPGVGLARALDAGGTHGAVTTTASTIPVGESLPQPRITDIQVESGLVRLTVKGTSPRLLYNVTAGSRPGELFARHAALAAKQGHERIDGEIEFVVPVRDDRCFFTVTRN